MSKVGRAQVNAQKRRLIAARSVDKSEKRMYVQVQYLYGFDEFQLIELTNFNLRIKKSAKTHNFFHS